MTDKEIYAYLKKNSPFTDAGIAGLMGNMYAESGLRSNNLQQIYEKSLGMTDETYTKAVDDGTYKNFVRDSAGYGLAQWTWWQRKENLLKHCRAKNKSIGDCETQLEYLLKEIKGYTQVYNCLKTTNSVKEASDIVLHQYEAPSDQSVSMEQRRAGYAQVYYDKYAPAADIKPETKVWYRVQVGAYTIKANAEAMARTVNKKGFDAIIRDVDGVFKVQLGAFEKEENAKELFNKAMSKGLKVIITK